MQLDDDLFRRLCRARAILADDAGAEAAPSIAEVARAVGISRFHFIRLFSPVFGDTPHQYRTRVRLERARRLLATGQSSVTEVCMDLGFSSLGSFSDLFRRRVGVSPSVYRRRAFAQVPHRLVHLPVPGCFGLMCGLPSALDSQYSRSPHRTSNPSVPASRPEAWSSRRSQRAPARSRSRSSPIPAET